MQTETGLHQRLACEACAFYWRRLACATKQLASLGAASLSAAPHLGGLVGVGAGDVLGHFVAHVLVVRGVVLLGARDVALDLLAGGLGRLLVVQRPGHSLLQVVARILVAVAVAVGAGQVVLQAAQRVC